MDALDHLRQTAELLDEIVDSIEYLESITGPAFISALEDLRQQRDTLNLFLENNDRADNAAQDQADGFAHREHVRSYYRPGYGFDREEDAQRAVGERSTEDVSDESDHCAQEGHLQ